MLTAEEKLIWVARVRPDILRDIDRLLKVALEKVEKFFFDGGAELGVDADTLMEAFDYLEKHSDPLELRAELAYLLAGNPNNLQLVLDKFFQFFAGGA